jgi:hypothetical protein
MVPAAPRTLSPSIRSSPSPDLVDLAPSPTGPAVAEQAAPAPNPKTLSTLANSFLRHPSRYIQQFFALLQELSRDDSFLRTLLFALALIVALLRRDVRARVRLAFAWLSRKVRETIVMGGKVGYL